MKKYWTAAGIARLDEECDELSERSYLHRQVIADARGGETNTFSLDGLADAISVREEAALFSAKLTEKQILLGTLRAAPIPVQTQQVQTGHLVRIRKEDDTEFAFIQGGDGEVNHDSEFSTLSCTAPLGIAIKGKSVGDTVEVRANDRMYEIEIISISIPKAQKAKHKTPA